MDSLVLWWYNWGVLLLLFVDIVVIAWLTYESQARGGRALGWQLSAALAALLVLPSLIFKFSNVVSQISMAGQIISFFYLGLIGSVASIIISAAGLVSISKAKPDATPIPAPLPTQMPVRETSRPAEAPPPRQPERRRVNAWLVDRLNDRNYQLFEGDSRLGRGQSNDIALDDHAVSREHVLIRQDGPHFTLYDRGSRTGSWVNEQPVREPVMLEHGDVIVLGDTELEFVTMR